MKPSIEYVTDTHTILGLRRDCLDPPVEGPTFPLDLTLTPDNGATTESARLHLPADDAFVSPRVFRFSVGFRFGHAPAPNGKRTSDHLDLLIFDERGRRLGAVLTTPNEPERDVPGAFRLHANYPNPFNPSTTIRFDLAAPTEVRLDVYDVYGRQVSTLVDERRPAGTHTATWDGRSQSGDRAASGVYFYRLTAEDRTESRAMHLLK